MRDPDRIPLILEKVRELWEKYPDLRLGQLIANAHNCSPNRKCDIFYIEDDLLTQGLEELGKEEGYRTTDAQ